MGFNLQFFPMSDLEDDIYLVNVQRHTLFEESFMIQIHSLQHYKEHEPVEHLRPLATNFQTTDALARFCHSCFLPWPQVQTFTTSVWGIEF